MESILITLILSMVMVTSYAAPVFIEEIIDEEPNEIMSAIVKSTELPSGGVEHTIWNKKKEVEDVRSTAVSTPVKSSSLPTTGTGRQPFFPTYVFTEEITDKTPYDVPEDLSAGGASMRNNFGNHREMEHFFSSTKQNVKYLDHNGVQNHGHGGLQDHHHENKYQAFSTLMLNCGFFSGGVLASIALFLIIRLCRSRNLRSNLNSSVELAQIQHITMPKSDGSNFHLDTLDCEMFTY